MADVVNSTIPCNKKTRDLFRAYVLHRQGKAGKRLTYDDILIELLDTVGWNESKMER